jgi:hypothetical protein
VCVSTSCALSIVGDRVDVVVCASASVVKIFQFSPASLAQFSRKQKIHGHVCVREKKKETVECFSEVTKGLFMF